MSYSDKWEVIYADCIDQIKLNDYLKKGWEPFAVTPPDRIWLRRLSKKRGRKPQRKEI